MTYSNAGGIAVLIIVTVLIMATVGGLAYVTANLGGGALNLSLIQAEADRESARAARAGAEAELTEEQANLKYAESELELKRAQGRALTIAANASAATVRTANRLTTFWGVSFPMMPPVYLLIGASFGIIAASGVAYSLGHKAGIRFILRNQLKVGVMEFVE